MQDGVKMMVKNLEGFSRGIGKKVDEIMKNKVEVKMHQAVDVIYEIAATPRAKIKNKQGKSISDPNAKFGVPVNTGRLQRSITKKVYSQNNHVYGEVTAGKGVPYAMNVEKGHRTKKGIVEPRAFMRSAYDLSKERIKSIFNNK